MNNSEIINKMSLKEKVSLLSGKDFWQTKDIPRLGINSIFLADGPHGIRKQAEAADHLGLNESIKSTCFPTASAIANSWDIELGEKIGRCLGEEANEQKVDILLGPGTNIKRNPLCGRNFEYFSEDPYLSGKMVSSVIKGIQSQGVNACVKHFVANNQEKRRMTINSIVDERALREIYLMPFEMAVLEGKTNSIMTSYNQINGIYANEHPYLLSQILRKEWKFNGLVVTDWGGNNNRCDALVNGGDLEMPFTNQETNYDVYKAVIDGKIEEKYVDESVDRILDIAKNIDPNLKSTCNYEKNHKIACRAAEQSIVLLKNKKNILPLGNNKKVAVIGDFAFEPRYQGAGSSIVNPTHVEKTIDIINEYELITVGSSRGYKRFGKQNKRMIADAVTLAKTSDVILLYLGLDEFSEVEGLDRNTMGLPNNQIELLNELKKIEKPIIAILACGCSVELDVLNDVDAIVHGFLSGQASARAILNVITGKVNPSGKLAESYAYAYNDCPSATNFPGGDITVEYRESIYVGYRYYDKVDSKVKYPFGYGLSYTIFEYEQLHVNDKGVTFKIKNTGEMDGAEIAQLYIGINDSKIFRVKKELKGFKKVFIKAGEEKKVFIPFDSYSFRYYDIQTSKFEIEKGVYTIYVGASSDDIRLSGDIEIDGTRDQIKIYDSKLLPTYYLGKASNVSKNEFESLLGYPLPPSNFEFNKNNRMIADYNTTVFELRYAKGWTGRVFAWVIRNLYKFARFINKPSLANLIMMGVYYMPLRGISRMLGGAISMHQLDGLIVMFNGKTMKGFREFLRGKKQTKKELAEITYD